MSIDTHRITFVLTVVRFISRLLETIRAWGARSVAIEISILGHTLWNAPQMVFPRIDVRGLVDGIGKEGSAFRAMRVSFRREPHLCDRRRGIVDDGKDGAIFLTRIMIGLTVGRNHKRRVVTGRRDEERFRTAVVGGRDDTAETCGFIP